MQDECFKVGEVRSSEGLYVYLESRAGVPQLGSASSIYVNVGRHILRRNVRTLADPCSPAQLQSEGPCNDRPTKAGTSPCKVPPVTFPLPGRFDRSSQVRHASHAPGADFLSKATNRIVQSHHLQAYTHSSFTKLLGKSVAPLQRAKVLLLAN
jgi:hypothetical protein